MPLYELAIIERPTKKEAEEGAQEKLVFGPRAVIAKDHQSALLGLILSGEIPKMDAAKAEVLVRPFAQ